jgi:hypothetical protein
MSWYVVGSDTFCIFNDILTQHLEVGMAGERTNFAASDWTVTGTSNHSHTNTMQVIFGFGTGSLELSKQSKRLILIPVGIEIENSGALVHWFKCSRSNYSQQNHLFSCHAHFNLGLFSRISKLRSKRAWSKLKNEWLQNGVEYCTRVHVDMYHHCALAWLRPCVFSHVKKVTRGPFDSVLPAQNQQTSRLGHWTWPDCLL